MDKGTFDLNGKNLTIAGLGGNAAGSAATGNVNNSGAGNNVLTTQRQARSHELTAMWKPAPRTAKPTIRSQTPCARMDSNHHGP